MAANHAIDKASVPEQLRVNTVELPSPTASGTTTPVRTGNEKNVTEINLEFPKNASNVTTPSSANRLNPFDTDVEAMHSSDNLNRKSVSCQSSRGNAIQNNSVWPGQDHWKQKARMAKMNNRSCTCLAHLSKRNRNIVKVLIGLLIIGIAVGVGVGISKPLGAEIWKPRHP